LNDEAGYTKRNALAFPFVHNVLFNATVDEKQPSTIKEIFYHTLLFAIRKSDPMIH